MIAVELLGSGDRRVSVRTVNTQNGAEFVDLDVVELGDDVDQIQRDHVVIGYIQRVGNVFVSLDGARWDTAEECGQFLLWDRAAAELLRQTDAAPDASRRMVPSDRNAADERLRV